MWRRQPCRCQPKTYRWSRAVAKAAAVPDSHPHLSIIFTEFGLMSLAPVATMLFLVDFVSRELGEATEVGS
jgi:hypothetical protein